MTEPVFIAETENPGSPDAARMWFQEKATAGRAKGGTWPRMAVSEDGTRILIEMWAERPDDPGEPRWGQ